MHGRRQILSTNAFYEYIMTCCMKLNYLHLLSDILYNCCLIIALEEGMPMFDTYLNCDVFVQYPVLFVAGDNPSASEFCHHIGSSANYFCWICEVSFKENAFHQI